MKISGLTIQGKTRDGLLESVRSELITHSDGIWRDRDERRNERVHTMLRLLLKLETLDGPDVWIGTSWGTLNFNLRDVTSHQLRLREVVFVEPYDISRDPPRYGYRFDFNLTGLDEDRIRHEVADLDEACAIIVRLLKSQQAHQPPRFF